MVEMGRGPVWEVDFNSRLHPHLPVEVIDRHELTSRVSPLKLASPQRPSCTMFLLLRSTNGSHTVDFTKIRARPRRLVQVRPGQIQCFSIDEAVDASLVMCEPGTGSACPWFPGHRSYCDLDDIATVTAHRVIAALRYQQTHFDNDEPTRRLMIALFTALAALFDQAVVAGADDRLPMAYVAFRGAVETDLTHKRAVSDYARELGYSARTISRACQEVTGQTAKRVLDERLVLESKRLLVHTDATAASIGTHLGFSEPTNFTKFFARYAGVTPGEFRHRHQRPGHDHLAGRPGARHADPHDRYGRGAGGHEADPPAHRGLAS